MYEYYDSEENDMKGTLRDWRKALRTPTSYRVGKTVRMQPQFVMMVLLIAVVLLVLFYYNWTSGADATLVPFRWTPSSRQYNATYPLTPPVTSGDTITYRIGIVADLDTNSKSDTKAHTHVSYLKKGSLSYNKAKDHLTVTWDDGPAQELSSTYSHKGRGMELSELIVYDGRLLTFDDRSGMVFRIVDKKIIPWIVLTDGNGEVEKGFKSEWATVKDEILYVGSIGKEWTTPTGKFQNYDPMWVKAVNIHGEIQHLNWVTQYKSIRSSISIQWPGYMIHESALWSPVTEKWHFLPRRCSNEPYNETKDEVMGCNYLITSDANFNQFHSKVITKHQPKMGFSSFKFMPGSDDEVIVALKTTEFEGATATYITAFKVDGKVLLPDTLVENLKYEGLEFI